MELNSYISMRIKDATASAETLELEPGKLMDQLYYVRDTSERKGIEYGFNLYWSGGKLKFGNTVRGTKESTPLNTSSEQKNKDYIGDFHVHPYKHRLHEKASIGPSITDLQEIVNKPPTMIPVGVYMIFAGDTLHLIIRNRDNINEDSAVQEGIMKGFKPDFTLRQDFLADRGIGHTHPFHKDKPAPVDEKSNKYIDSLGQEKAANSHIPSFHIVFSNQNLEMNRQYAARLDYDYYLADAKGGSKQKLVFRKEPRPILGPRGQDSPSAGLVCFKCRKVHSRKKSTMIGRWHRCRTCITIYCDWCGDALSRPVTITRERSCIREGCNGRTELID